MKYDFECKIHGIFEVDLKIIEEKKALCPECNAEAVRKYSHTPIHFHGKGFACNVPGAKKSTV